MMNLSVAIDDHEMGMTHVIRGKDHLNNTFRQEYIFDYFGWKKPEYYHYGLVNIPDTVLKTSIIKQSIKDAKPEVVSQLIDLALLGNGLLRGEALTKFIKRSVDLI